LRLADALAGMFFAAEGARLRPSIRLFLTRCYVATSIAHLVSFEVRRNNNRPALTPRLSRRVLAVGPYSRAPDVSGYLRCPGNQQRYETTDQRQCPFAVRSSMASTRQSPDEDCIVTTVRFEGVTAWWTSISPDHGARQSACR